MATKKALVVGISDYGGPPNNVSSCVKDAGAVARLLQESYGFAEIHAVHDRDATIGRIDEELSWLLKNVNADDRRVLFFSGLGYTKLVNGRLEEYLVVRDGLLDSDRLVAKTQDVAAGTLTVIVDASFAGGLEEFVFDPSGISPEFELAQVKVWKPAADDVARDKEFIQDGQHQRVSAYRRFGCAPITSRAAIARAFAVASARARSAPSASFAAHGGAWPSGARVAGDDGGQLELNGLLITACSETESAAAGTSKTEGLSALTCSLVASIERLGTSASATDLLIATESSLKALGFRQSPTLLERAVPGDLKLRRFVTLEPTTTAESLRFLYEPRFWEGVLTALAPQNIAPRAVTTREGDYMTTMFQPATGAYQPTPVSYQPFPGYQPAFAGPHLGFTGIPQGVGGYQQGVGGYQPSFVNAQQGWGAQPWSTDVQRLAPILANIIPAIVPQIVNNVLAQQRQLSMSNYPLGMTPVAWQQPFAVPFGSQAQVTDETQRLLPLLGPVLSSIIPTLVPQIVNQLLLQQQQQRAVHPFEGALGQPDVTQMVNQSVNDALQKIGIQTTPFAGRF